MRKLFSVLLVAPLLAGCAHSIYLAGRSTGVTGTAKVKGGMGSDGEIVLTLGGRVFTGRWVYMQTGGGFGIGSGTTFSGGSTTFTTGNFVGLPIGGNGNIIATAADGTSLRCVFDYSEWNNKGVGVCQDNKGETYDMQIT